MAIGKVIINRANLSDPSRVPRNREPTVSAYVTYLRESDAKKAIDAIHKTVADGKWLRCSFGTTKYCSYFLRGVRCTNTDCVYLHEYRTDPDVRGKSRSALAALVDTEGHEIPVKKTSEARMESRSSRESNMGRVPKHQWRINGTVIQPNRMKGRNNNNRNNRGGSNNRRISNPRVAFRNNRQQGTRMGNNHDGDYYEDRQNRSHNAWEEEDDRSGQRGSAKTQAYDDYDVESESESESNAEASEDDGEEEPLQKTVQQKVIAPPPSVETASSFAFGNGGNHNSFGAQNPIGLPSVTPQEKQKRDGVEYQAPYLMFGRGDGNGTPFYHSPQGSGNHGSFLFNDSGSSPVFAQLYQQQPPMQQRQPQQMLQPAQQGLQSLNSGPFVVGTGIAFSDLMKGEASDDFVFRFRSENNGRKKSRFV